jgi:uncharacterized protein with PIN domain
MKTNKLGTTALQISAVSTAAIVAGMGAASGSTVGLDVSDVNLTTGDLGSFSFDLNDDGVDDFEVSVVQIGSKSRGTVSSVKTKSEFGRGWVYPAFFNVGDVVDGTQKFGFANFVYEGTDETTFFGPEEGETTYLGLVLETYSDVVDGGIVSNYGWVELTRGSLTASRIGFQTNAGVGATITAPATGPTPVPLPATLPLLAAGFGGLAVMRRRKKAAA